MTSPDPAPPVKPKRAKAGGTGQGRTRTQSPTSPEGIARHERDLKNVQLRKAGVDWQTIADQLGYSSPGHAYNQFMRVMRDYPREDVETVREVIYDRYEAIVRALWAKVLKGDTWAIDRVNRALELQAKLMGANRPEKLEVSVGATELDAALRELDAEMKARAGGSPVPVE